MNAMSYPIFGILAATFLLLIGGAIYATVKDHKMAQRK
jgi:hypothetical protein